jgi:tetratricopeptide (TPR) repeat protein
MRPLKHFKTAVERAPADFGANFRLAEHLTRRLGQISEGRNYLARAKTTNPSSAPLFLLEGFLAWKQYEAEKNSAALEEAIALTEECLRLANLSIDHNSARLAHGNLAYYLAERNRTGDLEHAQTLCEYARGAHEVLWQDCR